MPFFNYWSKYSGYKGWCDEFDSRLNIIIGIVQKVYEWPSSPFTKLIPLWVHHFGKRIAQSLIYFLNYTYYDISPTVKFIASPFTLVVETLSYDNCLSLTLVKNFFAAVKIAIKVSISQGPSVHTNGQHHFIFELFSSLLTIIPQC